MTDMWDYGDGEIDRSYVIGFFTPASTSITAGMPVKPNATGANYVGCTVTSAVGDGFGVALKTPVSTSDNIPVLILGVYKFLAGGAVTVGTGVINSHLAGKGYVVAPGTVAIGNFAAFGGASYILGMALQSAAAAEDEILVLVGECFA